MLLFIFNCKYVSSDEVYLKNNDKITGKITEESAKSIVLETDTMGTVKIKRDSIARIVKGIAEPISEEVITATKEKEVTELKKSIWKKDVALGYGASRGNTENNNFHLSALLSKSRKHIDEITFKATIDYSSANKKMDTQKWYCLGRYAFSFGRTKKWYNFYRIEGDHDKFADIDYRLVPAGGVGYWFSDADIWKFLLECGLGYEYTVYNNETDTRKKIVLVPRLFIERKIFWNFTVSENLAFYNPVDNLGKYRLRSETKLTNPINNNWAIEFSIVDDYNTEPAGDAKKNDLSVFASLKCSL